MSKIKVELKSDHLDMVAKASKPINAIVELVWNALDADARNVDVSIIDSALGGMKEIQVSDDGQGVKYDVREESFGGLGGSWKRNTNRTLKEGRAIHGKAGKGRFQAFSLGEDVEWKIRYADNNKILSYNITGNNKDILSFDVTDPIPSDQNHTGTTVVIQNVHNFKTIDSDKNIQEFTEQFALYLKQYPHVTIRFNKKKIDPTSLQSNYTQINLKDIKLDAGRVISSSITIIEWNISTERTLYFCDEGGFAFHKLPAGVQAKGYNFTAYLKSDYILELHKTNFLTVEDLAPGMKELIALAKDSMKDHFRKRIAEDSCSLVEEWKQEEIYPYHGEPLSVIEEAERQVFDVCALSINSYLPDFDKSNNKSKKLSLMLIKQALEDSPQALQKILRDVLELPIEKQHELAELLEKTSLTAIINASKTVADRLDFIKGLEHLVFDAESRKLLLERTQLHRIIAEQTWIFGEEFNLSVDDQSLTEVLNKHLKLLGREPESKEHVRTLENGEGIVDLMLSRTIPQPRGDEREHLVIELKRPSQSVDDDVATQIKKYAFAVVEDERFRDVKTKWIFWAISNDISDAVRKEAKQKNRPEGILYEDPESNITIWTKTWGQVIQDCKSRLQFYQGQLQYTPDHESALSYLKKTHDKYLPKHLKIDANEDSGS